MLTATRGTKSPPAVSFLSQKCYLISIVDKSSFHAVKILEYKILFCQKLEGNTQPSGIIRRSNDG
ncbi:uncharacterized protein PHALS_00854 [Plasmopara halstedii]|uniref:Uncharacterized protein n=1 Tax=Plasmopara halstedii TaxID=4781 RepID=A0A0P1AT04_PLAHL|nr:uncharacterized protein PHALS_00854 [Plasmopara halstedii]CEG44494.1 hypothetical protein PHALS_00854 [Plasmopara halstedii]|eukprot:XP_024580863.1 hypothetical protein PHALS_00854 [Plasmopara halstedii]